jgi:parvulin-like peptidyl-prolyl isomerase
MAKNKPTKIVSKKHLARQERERRQKVAITFSAIGIIAVVVLLIVYAILFETMTFGYTFYNLRPQALQPIVKVNDDIVNTGNYQLRIRLYRQELINQYIQDYMFGMFFGVDPLTDSSISPELDKIKSQIDDPYTIGETIINQIIDNLLIRQYAKVNDITVTSDEIEQDIQSTLKYYPGGTPTPTVTPTTVTYPTLSSTQIALVSPTPTVTTAPTSTPRPTLTPEPTVTGTPEPTTIVPTSTPYTLEGFQSGYQNLLTQYAEVGLTDADLRRIYFEDKLYRQKVRAIITADVPHEQEQIWARHILVADFATAFIIRQQLIRGADFATLTAQYSTDTGSNGKGGDLGWFGRGAMVAEFETVAFELPVGFISGPVSTTYGWHIIQVLGHENRPLTDSEYQNALDKVFADWLQQQRNGATIKVYDYWSDRVPDTPKLEDAMNTLQQDTQQQQTPQPTQ